MNYNEIIAKAVEFATKAHDGQTRKDGKTYITHPIAVMGIARKNKTREPKKTTSDVWMEIFREELFIIEFCSIWHDLEDTIWNLKEAGAIVQFESEYLGFNSNNLPFKREILTALILLNKNSHTNYLEYILAVKTNDYAKAVKLADLEHNMSDLKEGSLKDKYRMAEYILTH